MKIAIVGAGFTGLGAAYQLISMGHSVTIFEKEKFVGGLASGFQEKNWDWTLEKTYHHLFRNDDTAISLMNNLGFGNKLIIRRPVTANLITNYRAKQEEFYQFDSPFNLLSFTPLRLIDRLRTGLLAAFCKIWPFWKPLENFTAESLVKIIAGNKSWQILWEPLMIGKFGNISETIAASWLWARIHKRTPKLCYIAGGFNALALQLQNQISDRGGKIYLEHELSKIQQVPDGKFKINGSIFNKVLLTVPSPIAVKLFDFPKTYQDKLLEINHLHAQTLIIETDKPILKNIYWLNVLDRDFPFLAVVAHTNFVDPKYYGSHHLTYFANYLPNNHPYLSKDKNALLKIFSPYIQRISQNKFKILDYKLFTAFNAQPVHTLHYSTIAPGLNTPVNNLYLANLDSVVPWDRGINYSLGLGINAAKSIGQR